MAQLPPTLVAYLDGLWRDVYSKCRAIARAEIVNTFGASWIGGKLNGSAISGQIPLTAVPAHASTHEAGGSDALPTDSLNPQISDRYEARTSDPGSPTDGQIWYRTDTHTPKVRKNATTTVFETQDNKGAANGYVPLDSGLLVPTTYLGAGTADTTTVLRGDRFWSNTVTGEWQAADFKASGLTGATAGGRWVGTTTSGAPGSGTFLIGDFVNTRDGHIFICTTAGSPGTWADAGSGSGMTNPMTTQYDIIVGGTSGTPARKAKGADGTFLGVSSGVLDYYTPSGSGNKVYTNATASPPSTPATNDMWFPSDGFEAFIYNGSVWVPIGLIYPLNASVPSAGWSWVNQSTATVSTANGGVFLRSPANATGQLMCRVRTIPTAPYNVDILVSCYMTAGVAGSVGFVLRESSSGKCAIFCLNASNPSIFRQLWSSATAFTSTGFNIGARANWPYQRIFMRIHDDNTTRFYAISYDGQNYENLGNEARATGFTTAPDQIGVFVNPQDPSNAISLTLYNWYEH